MFAYLMIVYFFIELKMQVFLKCFDGLFDARCLVLMTWLLINTNKWGFTAVLLIRYFALFLKVGLNRHEFI